MKTSTTIGIVVGLAALGGAAFILLRKPAEQKMDPLGNILAAAPSAIEGVGNAAGALSGAAPKIIKAGVDIAVAPTKAVISAGKQIVSSLKFW